MLELSLARGGSGGASVMPESEAALVSTDRGRSFSGLSKAALASRCLGETEESPDPSSSRKRVLNSRVTRYRVSVQPGEVILEANPHSWPTKALPVSNSDWLELLPPLLLRKTWLKFVSVGSSAGKWEFKAKSLTALTE